MQRHARPILLCVIGLLLAACQRAAVPAAKADELAVLPTGAPAKDEFVRYYIRKSIRRSEQASFFTTSRDFTLEQRRDVWLAVYYLPALWTPERTPGLLTVETDAEMPKVFHGGCGAVNLVADARTGRTLSSWCNVRMDAEGPEPALSDRPFYDSPDSPFKG